MRTLKAQYLRNFPLWLRVALWLALFLSPTGYVLFVLTLSRLQMPFPPAWFVVALFCLIPIVALLVCGTEVWLSKMRIGLKVGWLVLMVFAMLLQFGVWVVIMLGAITVAISPAQ